jgi:hypothetical protein
MRTTPLRLIVMPFLASQVLVMGALLPSQAW